MGCSLLVSYQIPFTYKSLLSCVAVGGIILTYKVRVKGLIITYALLTLLTLYTFPTMLREGCLSFLAIIFSFALETFIALLAIEEGEESFLALRKGNENQLEEHRLLHEELQKEKESQSYRIEALEGELEKFKEEAKLRKIEKSSLEKRLNLTLTEIEIHEEQKAALLDEVFAARQDGHSSFRSSKAELERVLEIKETEIASLKSQLEEEIEAKENALLSLKAQIEEKNQIEESLKASPPADPIPETNGELMRVLGLHKQLRQQFEEKTRILSEAREQLFKLETKLLSHEKEKELAQNGMTGEIILSGEELRNLEEILHFKEAQNRELEIEVNHLEELISHILMG